jgi:hypothetical protein
MDTIISGDRFGKLTVVKYMFKRNSRDMYLCLCDCGRETITMGHNLTKGNTKSCGCMRNSNNPNGRNGRG